MKPIPELEGKNIAIIDKGEIVENSSMQELLSKLEVETFVLDCIVCTPTSRKNKSADLTFVFNVVDSIAKEIKENKVIVIKSTVPPGTGLEIQSLFEHKLKNKNLSVQILMLTG